ncbi:MAG TPA: phosphoribosyl-AMP cyclohydrolase [Gammaproteobacteria bacterium]|nr:phosphoribosyl-AMP cyclohydrolase [Gammaproteobacteria bacterium]HBX27037.1 phosphoribosyl-AMP cyclohydrolase [Gammaproteobacteria bacterium]
MEIKEKNHRKRLLDNVCFNADGLISAIAQDHNTKTILMVAWMNRVALEQTLATGNVVYYSRSRKTLWRKGETSGQTQHLINIRIDCDRDAILLDVLQAGVACHTGRKSCFSWAPSKDGAWEPVEPVEIDPNLLYRGDQ